MTTGAADTARTGTPSPGERRVKAASGQPLIRHLAPDKRATETTVSVTIEFMIGKDDSSEDNNS